MKKKLISIAIPAYNEEDCVDKLYAELVKFFNKTDKYDFEVLIVENGSLDSTFQKLVKINQQDKRFKIIKLTRNFTADGGITAGIKHATGDALVVMFADLEDPLEIITQFIEKWEAGYKNVYGVVRKRSSGIIRRINSAMFYYVINLLTGGIVPKYVSEFRLVDKQVYQEINKLPEKNRFTRALFAWSGFKSIGVEYQRTTRAGGVSKAHTLTVLTLALRGIFSFSLIPLRLATVLGVITSFISFLGIVNFIVQYFIFGQSPFHGFSTIVCLMLMLFGIMFILIGILGEYVGLIYEEVKARPVYIVEQLIGFEEKAG